jgi:hypothetical protein
MARRTAGARRWPKAAGTTVERVNVHVTHVHDAPFADDTVEGLLAQHGMAGAAFDVAASHRAVEAAAAALKDRLMQARRNVTHVGHGAGNRGQGGRVEPAHPRPRW